MYQEISEQVKLQLKSKLGDYLREHKGINTDASFSCLNPEHEDRHPSMVYNSRSNCVHCYSCGVTYDLFTILGIDYNLATFPEQFNKARELYPAVGGLNEPPATRFSIAPGAVPVAPGTAEAAAPERVQTVAMFPVGKHENTGSTIISGTRPGMPQGGENPPAGTFHQGQVFGAGGVRFETSPAMTPEPGDLRPLERQNLHAYIERCHSQVGNTDYFRRRGLSDEVIQRFRLGYDDRYVAGSDPIQGVQTIWKAAIIPSSDFCITARNTDQKSPDRIRKSRGLRDVFNHEILGNAGEIFVVEGEFDALSLETLGYHALSLGGTGNVSWLLEQVRLNPVPNRMFYICLDNDEAGQQAAQMLCSGLYQQGIHYRQVNLAYPYKDPNEFLVHDRERLLHRLQNLEQLMSHTFVGRLSARTTDPILPDATALLTARFQCGLYVACGAVGLLRTLVTMLVVNSRKPMLYIGTMSQWQRLCDVLEHQIPAEAAATVSRIELLPAPATDRLPEHLEAEAESFMIQSPAGALLVLDLSAEGPEALPSRLSAASDCALRLRLPLLALCQGPGVAEGAAEQCFKLRTDENNVLWCDTALADGSAQSFALNAR